MVALAEARTVLANLKDDDVDETILGSVDYAFARHNQWYQEEVLDIWAIHEKWLEQGPVILGKGEQFLGHRVPPLWNLGDRPSAMALSFQAVADVLDNPTLFSADLYEKHGGRTLVNMDGDEHRRWRILLLQVFSPKVIKRWDSEINQPVIERLLDDIEGTARLDIFPRFFRKISPTIFAHLCALPIEQLDTFSAWTMWQFFPHDLYGRTAAMRLNAFLREQVGLVRQLPPDGRAQRTDLIATLVNANVDGEEISDEDIAAAIQLIIIGGTDTVGRSMANTAYYLFTEAGALARVKADRSLIPIAIEESLRLSPPNTIQGRKLEKDIEFHGVPIKAGTAMHINQVTANRDPSIWENPHSWDLDRPKHRSHVWGTGPHACVGMHLARTEMIVGFNRLFDRFPNVRLDSDQPPPAVQGFGFNGPVELHVITS